MTNDDNQMRENNLAYLAMRRWKPPSSLPSRGKTAWHQWALHQAVLAVREGRIDGVYERTENAYTFDYRLTRTIPNPIIPDELYEAWKAMPRSFFEEQTGRVEQKSSANKTQDATVSGN